jgi:hypothetical protein
MLANAAPSRLYLDLLNYASAARNSRASPPLHAKNRAFEVSSAVAVVSDVRARIAPGFSEPIVGVVLQYPEGLTDGLRLSLEKK